MKKNSKEFPVTPGPKIRVHTMAACCVRYWYELWEKEALPESGRMTCQSCHAILRRTKSNWWFGSRT